MCSCTRLLVHVRGVCLCVRACGRACVYVRVCVRASVRLCISNLMRIGRLQHWQSKYRMLMYAIQVTIHPSRMKVFVCFAAICFLALVIAQEEDVDDSPAVRMPSRNRGVFLFGLYII